MATSGEKFIYITHSFPQQKQRQNLVTLIVRSLYISNE